MEQHTTATEGLVHMASKLDDTFLLALSRAGISHEERSLTDDLGIRGAAGEELATRWALVGNPDAAYVIVVTTGLHGAEREPGTKFLASLLAHPRELHRFLGRDIALLLIDNLNPWGCSFGSRYDQHGRDLNRTNGGTSAMPDFGHSLFYGEVDADLNLPRLGLFSGIQAAARLLHYRYGQRDGFDRVADIIARGQDHDPSRMMYVTKEPAWSNIILRHIIRKHLRACRHVIHPDLHTALGKWSQLLKVSIEEPGSERYQRAVRLFGSDLVSTQVPNRYTHSGAGTIEQLFFRELRADQTYTGICVEGGTLPISFVIAAMWLRHNVLKHRVSDPAFYARNDEWTRALVRQAFAPPYACWQGAILRKMHRLLQRTIHHTRSGALQST